MNIGRLAKSICAALPKISGSTGVEGTAPKLITDYPLAQQPQVANALVNIVARNVEDGPCTVAVHEWHGDTLGPLGGWVAARKCRSLPAPFRKNIRGGHIPPVGDEVGTDRRVKKQRCLHSRLTKWLINLFSIFCPEVVG